MHPYLNTYAHYFVLIHIYFILPRARVVSRLQQITKLDLSTVSAEEKIRALNLYRLPGGDVESRQAVFGKYFPGEPVENGQEFEDDEGNFTA